MLKRAFSLVLLLAVVGCGENDPNVQFSSSLLPSAAAAQKSISVQSAISSLYGAGTIIVPNACQRLHADADVKPGSITVTITASNTRADCAPGAGAYSFQFSVEGVKPGTYTARVVYDYSGQQPTETVLQKEIRIS